MDSRLAAIAPSVLLAGLIGFQLLLAAGLASCRAYGRLRSGFKGDLTH